MVDTSAYRWMPGGYYALDGSGPYSIDSSGVAHLIGTGSSGGGGSGDASAANQATQIVAEQATAAALGTTADAAPASLAAVGTVPAWLRWLARGIGAPSDAAAPSGTGLIGLMQALVARLPASLGATTAAQSLPVTLASDGALVTAVGSTTAAAPADGATSGTVVGWLRAAVETLRARLPTLSSGRIPVETTQASGSVTVVRLRDIITDTTSIGGLAASSSATGASVDLGATHSTCTVTLLKSGGAVQADTVQIQQSDDGITWYLMPRADSSVGTSYGWSNMSSAAVVAIGRPSMRYVRSRIDTTAGAAQPGSATLFLAVHWGV